MYILCLSIFRGEKIRFRLVIFIPEKTLGYYLGICSTAELGSTPSVTEIFKGAFGNNLIQYCYIAVQREAKFTIMV